MREPINGHARLALDLALTIRHDGKGGVTDDLTGPADLTEWVRAHPEVRQPGFAADGCAAGRPGGCCRRSRAACRSRRNRRRPRPAR
ncbi:hypothetical protein G3I77_32935 [Streptomyces sp. D2-8]|uniref:ABATE domain-containing protein n=1 Tax=Streptomyces sp. D2-8 TaxID=2707767 RepID=UPI0027E4B7DC|nr:ABATE domain-containing protein [Streptomyces sp. D2-8]MCK8437637.1 hypothetical protein [Streptomyces sp. D2-8]